MRPPGVTIRNMGRTNTPLQDRKRRHVLDVTARRVSGSPSGLT